MSLSDLRHVVILGMSKDTRNMVPWGELEDPPECEVWVLNEMGDTQYVHKNGEKPFAFVKRWDRLWQMHPKWDFSRPHNYNHSSYWEWLQNQDGERPIVMQEAFDEVPGSMEFPLDELLEQASEMGRRFTSTVAYMLAYCAWLYMRHDALEKIDLYGFSMGAETEYRYQRDATTFWLGVLEGLMWTTGAPEVFIPEPSKLHPKWQKMYGYEGTQLIPPEEIEKRRDMWRRVADRYWPRAQELHEDVMERLSKGAPEEAVADLVEQRSEEFQRFKAADACARENEYWLKTGTAVPRMHFELRNRAWKKKHEKALIFLNNTAGDVKRLRKQIQETPEQNRGVIERLKEELQELVEKQEKYGQQLIYSGAVREENQRWIRQCDMIEQGIESGNDSDVVPRVQLQYIEDETP